MDQISNDHIIKQFLTHIPQYQHLKTIKQLIYIGINMVSGVLYQQPHTSPNTPPNILTEIQNIKAKLNEIANVISSTKNIPDNNPTVYSHYIQSQPLNHKIIPTEHDQLNPSRLTYIPTKDSITPKVTQIAPDNLPPNQVKVRGKTRTHLDDTQLKQAMIHPISPPKKKKANLPSITSYPIPMQPTNKLIANHQPIQQKVIVTGYTSNPKINAKSKIKSLIDRDKMNYHYDQTHQNNNQHTKHPQFHYEDDDQSQNDQEQLFETLRNKEHIQIKQNLQHFKHKQKKHQPQVITTMTFKKNKKQQNLFEEERQQKQEAQQRQERQEKVERQQNNLSKYNQQHNDDNSSSFSEFSLASSKRQVGKISRKK